MSVTENRARDLMQSLVERVPLLHDDYPYGRLLAAVTAARRFRVSSPAARALEAVVRPDPLAPHYGVEPPDESVYARLGPEVARAVQLQLEEIVRAVPAWRQPLSIPIEYRYLPESSEAVSASNPATPQVIFLGRQTPASATELREQLVHEICHQWQYLIEEIVPLEVPDQARVHSLPSGTSERSPREVLGAYHVAATLIRFYKVLGEGSQVVALGEYADGCAAMLKELSEVLTPAGQDVVELIRETLE